MNFQLHYILLNYIISLTISSIKGNHTSQITYRQEKSHKSGEVSHIVITFGLHLSLQCVTRILLVLIMHTEMECIGMQAIITPHAFPLCRSCTLSERQLYPVNLHYGMTHSMFIWLLCHHLSITSHSLKCFKLSALLQAS